MPRAASIPYDPVNSVSPTEQGAPGISVRASPEDFGGQIGQAEQQLGATAQETGNKGMELATKYAAQATEAKANDIIATQWAPAVSKLSGYYQETQGLDAVKGLDQFQKNLQDLHNQYLGQATNPYEKEILGNYMTRHIAQEMDSAQRHQDQQMTHFEDQSHTAFVNTLSSNAIANYNNPNVIDQTKTQLDAQIQKHGMDRGLSQDMIDEQQRDAWGKTIKNSVIRAVANGDVSTASKLYDANKQNIPGNEQLEIDKVLHTENMKQFGSNAATALLNGQPVPTPSAGTPTQVRAVVANTAQASGVDPNHALTVASIESDFGQNVGKRGDIGQTGKPGDLHEQAQNLTTELKKSDDAATNALGRQSQPWEGYICYQQGAGGGPALLKAAQDNPLAKAVDVLNPLYDSPKKALSAVVNNGGNATMTAGQFLDFIKNKYNAHASRAMCEIPETSTAPLQTPIPDERAAEEQAPPSQLGNAIEAPHLESGVTMQKGVTPTQALFELDKVYPDALQRANQIPNLDQREATLHALEQQHTVYQAASNAYTTTLINQANKLAVDPKFTSMDQVPTELSAALLSDHPQTLAYMEARANYNLEHGSGSVTKDQKDYGSGVDKVTQGIWNGEITSTGQLQSYVANHELSLSGYDRMEKLLANKGTPEGQAETKLQEQTFKAVRSWFLGKADLYNIPDPHGEEAYGQAMAAMFKAVDDAKTNKIPYNELYDPSNKNWVGNVAKPLVRTLEQRVSDINAEGGNVAQSGSTDPSTQEGLRNAIISGKMTKDEGRKLAMERGWIRLEGPQVPIAQ